MKREAVNKNAIREVQAVLDYLADIEGKHILTGQHTQTMAQEELGRIHGITGKYPALCGFELLSYSQNIRLETADEACKKEVRENQGTLQKAWEWAEKGGLLTFTWHWFSPLGGRDKSFYACNTEFDAKKALLEGTKEHAAFLHDLDAMAELLRPFGEKHVPILWRPFHEAEGNWFWWGAFGGDTARELYRFMFRYYTKKHHLDNLIWVWNSPAPAGYVGDEYCDIISRDMYPPAHAHSDFREAYQGLLRITGQEKGCAIAETGIIPDADWLERYHTKWLWYMTWSGDFARTQKWNSDAALKKLYAHPYAVTLEKLPKLYEIL